MWARVWRLTGLLWGGMAALLIGARLLGMILPANPTILVYTPTSPTVRRAEVDIGRRLVIPLTSAQSPSTQPERNEVGELAAPNGNTLRYESLGGGSWDWTLEIDTPDDDDSITISRAAYYPPDSVYWSADGTRLFYAERYTAAYASAVVMFDLTTGEHVRLLEQLDGRILPNNDTRYLAATHYEDGQMALTVIDLANGHTRRISNALTQAGFFVWADGPYLVALENRDSSSVFVRHNILDSRQDVTPATYPLALHPMDVHWSVGRRYFAIAYPDRRGSNEVTIVDVETLHSRSITDYGAVDFIDADFIWSPSGQLLLMIVRRAGLDNLWVYDAPNDHMRPLTQLHNQWIADAKWHPDGESVWFVGASLNTQTFNELYRVRVSGRVAPEHIRTLPTFDSGRGRWFVWPIE